MFVITERLYAHPVYLIEAEMFFELKDSCVDFRDPLPVSMGSVNTLT